MLISGKQGNMMGELERAGKWPRVPDSRDPNEFISEYFIQRITNNLEDHENKLLKMEQGDGIQN